MLDKKQKSICSFVGPWIVSAYPLGESLRHLLSFYSRRRFYFISLTTTHSPPQTHSHPNILAHTLAHTCAARFIHNLCQKHIGLDSTLSTTASPLLPLPPPTSRIPSVSLSSNEHRKCHHTCCVCLCVSVSVRVWGIPWGIRCGWGC